jgi:hypothetical protein
MSSPSAAAKAPKSPKDSEDPKEKKPKIPTWVWALAGIVLLGSVRRRVDDATGVPPPWDKPPGPGPGPTHPADTSDWTDADVAAYRTFTRALGVPLDVPLRVWAFESDNRATAHNAAAFDSGIFQLIPSSARSLGYPISDDPELAKFRAMSVKEQLAWALKFYGPHRGKIGTQTRFHIATWLPAWLVDPNANVDDPTFRLAGKTGPYASQYEATKFAFDREGKGYVTPADMQGAEDRAYGPRTRALWARISQEIA